MNTRPLILLLLVFYVFSPTLFNWMINPSGSWYRPYIIWAVVIVLAYFVQGRRGSDEL